METEDFPSSSSCNFAPIPVQPEQAGVGPDILRHIESKCVLFLVVIQMRRDISVCGHIKYILNGIWRDDTAS